ncbi:MAG TPA: hypothetical protein VIK11_06500, partial [Tepidiformaceae bacterium]
VTREELAASFTIDRVVPNPAMFDIERLNFLNGHFIREMDESRWHATIADWCERQLDAAVPRPIAADFVAEVAPLLRKRVARLDQIAPMVGFLFGTDAPEYVPALLAERVGGDPSVARQVVDAALVALDAIPAAEWSQALVEAAVRGLEQPLSMKLRKFVSVLYVAEMGVPQGIPLFDSMVLLGRERALHRLRAARARLEHSRA